MSRILNRLKTKFSPVEYIFFPILLALFYVNSPLFPNSSIDSKLEFLSIGCRKYLIFFFKLQKDWNSGYLNVAPGWIPKFLSLEIEIFQEIEIWYFLILANK